MCRSCLTCLSLLSLVRHRIHALRQFTELLKKPLFLFVVSLGNDFRLSPYSALSLVRQWIHALRQFTELFQEAHISSTFGSPYSALCLVQKWIHASVCLLRIGIFTDFFREGGLGPCGGRRPVGREVETCSLGERRSVAKIQLWEMWRQSLSWQQSC